MKQNNRSLRLHMGCGEGLVACMTLPPRNEQRAHTTPSRRSLTPVGKGKR